MCISPIFTLAESFSVDGSAHHGLDYGRLRLWASLSFLSGNLGAGALLLYLPISSLIYLIAVAQGVSSLVAFMLPADPVARQPMQLSERPAQHIQRLQAPDDGRVRHFYCCGEPRPVDPCHALLLRSRSNGTGLGYDEFTIGSFWAISIVGEVTLFGFSNALVNRFGADQSHSAWHFRRLPALAFHVA